MRTVLSNDQINCAIDTVINSLFIRFQEKGFGSAVSLHEIRGIVDEEIEEMHEAIRDNDREKTRKELIDIAVGCILGITSIDNFNRIDNENNA